MAIEQEREMLERLNFDPTEAHRSMEEFINFVAVRYPDGPYKELAYGMLATAIISLHRCGLDPNEIQLVFSCAMTSRFGLPLTVGVLEMPGPPGSDENGGGEDDNGPLMN